VRLRGRLRCRTDANHVAIVKALRQAGASVQSLSNVGDGCPDVLIGFGGKNFLMEIKNGLLRPAKRRLTSSEQAWQANWKGQIVTVKSVEEALRAFAGMRHENQQ
jgi:hypothetical protein